LQVKKINPVEEFLAWYTSASTRATYNSHLKNFFKAINADPETYFDDSRDYEADLKQFFIALQEENRPPKSMIASLYTVKSFLEEFGHPPSKRFWKRLVNRIQGNKAVTRAIVPKPEDLRKILEYADLKLRALFLMISSSGMRLSEALSLTEKDIDMGKEPTRIYIRAEETKTGNRRTTFISQEATQALEQWLRDRDRYLRQAVKKSNIHKKAPHDDRVFPFSSDVARRAWNLVLEKAGFDERDPRTNYHLLRPHNLRKYFRTHLAYAINPDIVEALMGHEEGQTHIYRLYNEDTLAAEYKKGEHALVVFHKPLDTEGITDELRDMKRRYMEVRQDMDRLMKYVEHSTSVDMSYGGRMTGGEWRREPDGSLQLYYFDRYSRTFMPFGDKIPPITSYKDHQDLQQQEHQQHLKKQEIMQELYRQQHGLSEQQLHQRLKEQEQIELQERREIDRLYQEQSDGKK